MTESPPVTWGLDRVDQRSQPLDGIYNVYGNGTDIPVYVIDSGINVDHDDFGGRAVNWFDATGEDGKDCSGHGTHCAGTVGSEHYGVAPGVILFSARVFNCEGKGYKSITIKAMNEVLINGTAPAVVSMSLGGSPNQAQDEMVKILFEAGFVVVVAAGNNDDDACLKSPARAYEAITVGATNINDTRAYFSNYGIAVDMFAPGRYIESLDFETNNGTSVKSGTSMATPHVSGLAAILIGKGTLPEDVPDAIYDLTTKEIVKDAGEYSYNRFMYVPNS
ncbi:extracellular serine proteinase-like [Antedon mediterranea]|uniref:extracellular serine proteinase-like n=1 Tax=Antedon mediterranea TaxID=105859 RepID=UPI003AF9B444